MSNEEIIHTDLIADLLHNEQLHLESKANPVVDWDEEGRKMNENYLAELKEQGKEICPMCWGEKEIAAQECSSCIQQMADKAERAALEAEWAKHAHDDRW